MNSGLRLWHRLLVRTVALLALCGAVVLSPSVVSADSVTGPVVVTWFFPDTSTVLATGSAAVGTTQSCANTTNTIPGICAALPPFVGTTFTVGVGTDSITTTIFSFGHFAPGAFNGFVFSDLTFASGNPLTGFILTNNTFAGFSASDVTFGPSSIAINLQGLPIDGAVELTLLTATPEPSSFALVGTGLLGVWSLLSIRLPRKRTS